MPFIRSKQNNQVIRSTGVLTALGVCYVVLPFKMLMKGKMSKV